MVHSYWNIYGRIAFTLLPANVDLWCSLCQANVMDEMVAVENDGCWTMNMVST